jgi:hypothetical protein
MFESVKRGGLFGFAIGGLLWILAAVLRLGNASVADPGLLALGVVFVAGGTAGGITAGAVVHLTRWWIGAMVVGFAGAIPVIVGIAILEDGRLSAANVNAVVWVSIILGCPAGLIFRHLWRKIDPLGPL